MEGTTGEMAAALVRRIAAGDRQAEARLVERYSRGLVYLLKRLTSDPALSDDLHQETFRIVLEKIRGGELHQPDKVGAFIRATARNLAIAEYRRQARRNPLQELENRDEPPDPAPGQLGRIIQEEDRRRIRQLLSELKHERDRQLLYRFHIAEDDKEEICHQLELSSRQFNLILHRARQRFKALVERSEGLRENRDCSVQSSANDRH